MENESVKDKDSRILAGILTGIAVGAAIGILLAPNKCTPKKVLRSSWKEASKYFDKKANVAAKILDKKATVASKYLDKKAAVASDELDTLKEKVLDYTKQLLDDLRSKL
ncbi:MAG: hypothetical protein INR69_03455 [Mucilaginibacter polytrichastri]|nr:hypothetical protein [Mucilaginibacter polytrichastri]